MRQIRPSSAFSLNCLVTSRSALVAASWAVSFAIRVLRWTWAARYQSEATTANELISCAVALIASQLIACRTYQAQHHLQPATAMKKNEPANTPNDAKRGGVCRAAKFL